MMKVLLWEQFLGKKNEHWLVKKKLWHFIFFQYDVSAKNNTLSNTSVIINITQNKDVRKIKKKKKT